MKKLSILHFLFVLVVCSGLSGQNSFRIQDPDRTWSNITGTISYVEYVIRPGKNFVTCDLYMTYLCKNPNFNPNIQYEVSHLFTLPANTLVTDSWLWVDTTIMKADILERSEAINIYEGIVKRRRDPSLLLKNSPTSYDFKIYPIFNNNFRRVKLRFEIPIEINKDSRSFSLPVSMLLTSLVKPEVIIKIIDDENYTYSTDFGVPVTMVDDPKLGFIYQAKVIPEVDLLNIQIESGPFEPSLSYVYENQTSPPNGFYQISMQPSSAFEFSSHKDRNVVLLIEHDSVFSYFTKQHVMQAATDFVEKYLREGDSLQILYNGTGIKKHYSDFIPYNDLKSMAPISSVKLGSFSTMPSSLFESHELLKNRSNPVLVIFSSAGNITSPTIAQAIKNELEASYGSLVKTFVFSYINEKATQYSYSGQAFRGNALLHVILTSNSGGHLGSTPLNLKSVQGWIPHRNTFGRQFDLLTQKPFEIQYTFKPHNGLTYDNILFRNDANGWMQIGRFTGSPPFELDAVLWIDNQLSQRNLTIEGNEESAEVEKFRQIHQGHKILAMENTNLLANKFNIINASLTHRVLSRYTAFLALEPGLQDPCVDCTDESSTTSTDDLSESVQWKVYPNPFYDRVVLELSGLNSDEKPEEISLYNTQGEKQDVTVFILQDGDKWLFEVHSGDIPAGVYFLKVRVGKRILTHKLVKIG